VSPVSLFPWFTLFSTCNKNTVNVCFVLSFMNPKKQNILTSGCLCVNSHWPVKQIKRQQKRQKVQRSILNSTEINGDYIDGSLLKITKQGVTIGTFIKVSMKTKWSIIVLRSIAIFNINKFVPFNQDNFPRPSASLSSLMTHLRVWGRGNLSHMQGEHHKHTDYKFLWDISLILKHNLKLLYNVYLT